jgi:UDP-glucose 4-epimerase
VSDHLVLVTGATGAVGPAVVDACLGRGWRVRTLSADAGPAGLFPPEVDARVGDVGDTTAVQSAVEGVAGVVHLAALLHRFGPAALEADAYRHVNVEGTRTVVEAAQAAGVERVVFLSTISVYRPSPGSMLDEQSPVEPVTWYGRSKLEAESIVRAAMVDGRPIGTVLRAAAVYGPRVKGNYRRLAEAIACRRFMPIGDGRNRRTLVHVRDLARAIVTGSFAPAIPVLSSTPSAPSSMATVTSDAVAFSCSRSTYRPSTSWLPRAIS